jgi:hypothetical protein
MLVQDSDLTKCSSLPLADVDLDALVNHNGHSSVGIGAYSPRASNDVEAPERNGQVAADWCVIITDPS